LRPSRSGPSRSPHLGSGRIIDTLKTKDVGLRILNMNFDTASPTGKMMLTILGSIAQFEREIMLERQKRE
jgi:DNA invertase Pin-like site-specific DNA recombinase